MTVSEFCQLVEKMICLYQRWFEFTTLTFNLRNRWEGVLQQISYIGIWCPQICGFKPFWYKDRSVYIFTILVWNWVWFSRKPHKGINVTDFSTWIKGKHKYEKYIFLLSFLSDFCNFLTSALIQAFFRYSDRSLLEKRGNRSLAWSIASW